MDTSSAYPKIYIRRLERQETPPKLKVEQTIKINESGNIYVDKGNILFSKENKDIKTHFKVIFDTKKCSAYIECSNQDQKYVENTDATLWLNLRTKNIGYCPPRKLERQDVFYIGNTVFRVNDYRIQKSLNPLDNNADYSEEKLIIDTHKNNTLCYICKEANSTKENPLLKICQCEKLAHFYCQSRYMANITKRIKTSNVMSMYCTHFECQEEKDKKVMPEKDQNINSFPNIIQYNSQRYTLFDIGRPEYGDYIVLETLTIPHGLSKIIHVFTPSPSGNKITIGRGSRSDIRTIDEQAFRLHTKIIYKNDDGFYISNISNRGTLLRVKSKQVLEVGAPLLFKIGSTEFVIILYASESNDLVLKEEDIKLNLPDEDDERISKVPNK